MIFDVKIYREEKRNLIFWDREFIEDFSDKYNLEIIFKFYN